MNRDDWRQMLIDLPAAVLCMLGLIAFLVILFALVPGAE